MKKFPLILFIIAIAGLLRFYNLMHDAPYFFNPDERNMANAISQFRLPSNPSQIPTCLLSQINPSSNLQPTTYKLQANNCNLNPHFFAYGQFPLYLAFVSDQLTKPLNNLISSEPMTNDQSLMTSFSSAIFYLRFYSALSSICTLIDSAAKSSLISLVFTRIAALSLSA
ncbi:hypothetical protein HY407_00465 [Candidatus Gottesmanbacteria bacterium]|nr:hypothetical protein [Candidatus Gottesmanbacteria bacterium]